MPSYDPRRYLSLGRVYDVEREGGTDQGRLISLDEDGFVVLEDENGQRIIIRKDLVKRLKEVAQ